MDNFFKAWLQVFGRWLMHHNQTPPKPLMTEERWIEGPPRQLESRLTLLPDEDERFRRPGAIATWKLVNRSAPNGGLLVTLDNLFKLASDLPPTSKSAPIILRGLERSLGLTHRFQAAWIYRYSPESKLRFIMLACLDIDLSSHYIDESAKEVIRYTVLDAFNMRNTALSWQERVTLFPWYETIAQLSPKKGCPSNPRCRVLCRRTQKVTFS